MFDAVTTSMFEPEHYTEKIRQIFWPVWDEWVETHYPTDHGDIPIPAHEVLVHLAALTREKARKAGFSGGVLKAVDVRRWLENADRSTPYADEVKIARALAFDFSCYSTLSIGERRVFFERLGRGPRPDTKEDEGYARWPAKDRHALNAAWREANARAGRAA